MPKVTPSVLLLAVLSGATLKAADRPWQHLTDPTAAAAAAGFAAPAPEYSPTVTWGWNGPMSEEVITRDLDTLHARGFRAATIEAGYRMDNAPYLSDGWFKLIRFAAEQAHARGMRLWIIDEGKYPSGFAGGLFTAQRPDLRMQGIALAEKIAVAPGETVTRTPAPEVVGVLAVNEETGGSRVLAPAAGVVTFTAPAAGRWSVLVVDHQFRTGDTRAVNDPTQAKTKANSMGDLLSPAAVDQFIAWTHEAYRQHVGDLFGRAILGFRGDEPDFANTPWNAALPDEFQRRKGYDVRPYLPYVAGFGPNMTALQLTDEQRRAKADYWDVWSDLFAQNFFQRQAEWCRAQGVEYMVHLNQDHDLFLNVRSSGDFFRNMRSVSVPGIDVIWSQIYPGRGPADFPKFASSAAHVYGHPRALSESFAAFRDPVTLDVARWVVNQQLVRGISLFEFMFFVSSAPRPLPGDRPGATPAGTVPARPANSEAAARGYMLDPGFPAFAAATHRAQFLLAQGRPAAQIAVYAPTPSFFLGDRDANTSILQISQGLTEAQRDFDYVDEAALASVMKLQAGGFTNLSGQTYRAVIIPSITAISQAALDRLHAFAQAGGVVISLGRVPALVTGPTFLHAGGPANLDWAVREPAGGLTAAVFAALPPPDVSLDQPAPGLKATHRRLRDADVYFFFNEGKESVTRTVTLAGTGTVQVWDAATGQIAPVAGTEPAGGAVKLPLTLAASESRFIVIHATSAGER
jgi:hypothetical protein